MREKPHEIRNVLRAAAAQALGCRRRTPTRAGRPASGRARRPARHRLRLGGRAPLPRGIFALLGIGGVPGRRRRAHQAHQARPRHPPGDRQLQSSRPHGGSRRHARPRLQRPRGVRHRRGRDPARARRLQHPGQREARHVAGGGRADRQHDGDGALPGLRGPLVQDALPQRAAQADAEAASAHVDGLHQPRHHQGGGEQRPGRAGVFLHRRGGGAHLERRSTTTSSRARRACPLGHTRQRQHRHGVGVLAARRSRGGRATRTGGLRVLPLCHFRAGRRTTPCRAARGCSSNSKRSAAAARCSMRRGARGGLASAFQRSRGIGTPEDFRDM